MSGEILKEGQLRKEGGSIKTWKTRWCVLTNDGYLRYYDGNAKSTENLKGQISLKTCSEIQPVDYKNKKFCFELRTPQRNYHLIATNDKEMRDWIDAVQKALEQLNAGTKKAPAKPETAHSPEPAHSESDTTVKLDDFESLKVIGRGSFGKVLLVRHNHTKKIYAMKVLNKRTIIERNELEHTKAEKSILMKLESPFLVRLHYSFQTKDKLYFVMDYINGGELFCHLQKEKMFTPKRVQFYSAEIVLGLEYLHKQGVIYRDLKPENLLLTKEGHICMTDFGISKEGLHCKDDKTATFCGTPEYLAPEVLEGKGYGKGVDWWSFGTLMFEMLTGLPPFYHEDVQLMYSKIMNAKLQVPKHLGEDACSLLSQLLERDPAKRITDPDRIKSHPYFADIDWDKLAKQQMVPPYIPPVSADDDWSLIDPSFTSENAKFSQTEDSHIGDVSEKFEGFTYVAESNLRG